MARAAESVIEVPDVEPSRGWLAVGWDFCRERPLGAIGAAVVLVNLVVALAANVLAPYDPVATDYAAMLAAPSRAHWLGTDAFGRDVLSRIIYGPPDAAPGGVSGAAG